MFQIKICGITNVDDALHAVQEGADAIGLNFYKASKRFIDIAAAMKISERVGDQVLKVGVFVNSSPDEIGLLAEKIGLDAVQLHGDEKPEDVANLDPHSVIKAFRCQHGELDPVRQFLDQANALNAPPESILLDAYHPEQYGGTGESIDLDRLVDRIDQIRHKHWVLAGGLNHKNIAGAIRKIRPNAVDAASGVEVNARKKDPQKVAEFISEAKHAFALLSKQT